MLEKDVPNFKEWKQNNLWKFSEEAYLKILELEDLNEQLRNDFKDLIKIVRLHSMGKIDYE
jgi:hypothetical protein